MKKIFLAYFLLTLLIACSKSSPVPNNKPANTLSDSQAVAAAKQALDLQNQIGQIASVAKGKVGVAAVVIETGEAVSLNSSDHFPMQSVYKLPISMAVMKQVDAGKLKLDQKVPVTKDDFVGRNQHSPIRDENPNGVELTVDELVRFAISESDGTASDVLMKLAGGAAAVQAYLTGLSITGWIVLNTENELGKDYQLQYRNWASPEAAVALLRALHERSRFSESNRALLLKYLAESKPGANRLKGLLPAGTVVAHKTGTSGSRDGITAATNDIGIITLPNGKHVAIAVFVSDSPADETTREGVIAKIAKAAWDAYGK